MEQTVYGNGKPGLAEDVRNIKSKWAVIYGVSIILLSSLGHAIAAAVLH